MALKRFSLSSPRMTLLVESPQFGHLRFCKSHPEIRNTKVPYRYYKRSKSKGKNGLHCALSGQDNNVGLHGYMVGKGDISVISVGKKIAQRALAVREIHHYRHKTVSNGE
jgi:hypothetical protein